MGALRAYLEEDHQRLSALLDRSVQDPERFDHDAFEEFRAGLLRHIGIEEKIVLPDMRRRLGAPHPLATRLRIDHGALGSLLVPTPDAALVDEIRSILDAHDPLEEGEDGLYAECERLAGDELPALVERARQAPEVPLNRHNDGPNTYRRAADALAAMERIYSKRATD